MLREVRRFKSLFCFGIGTLAAMLYGEADCLRQLRLIVADIADLAYDYGSIGRSENELVNH
jgi:hypothetical protein